jgi:multicomponent Na+:H+ antiporter subunit E
MRENLRRPYLWLILAGCWMLLQDSYSLGSFAAGLILAGIVLAMLPAPVVDLIHIQRDRPYGLVGWFGRFARLVVYFLYEMLRANAQVSALVLRRRIRLQPGILAMPLKCTSPGQVTLLAMLITLTPGTVSVDVSPDEDVLYIHTIDAVNADETLRVPRRFEQMVMEVLG